MNPGHSEYETAVLTNRLRFRC